MQVAVQKLCCFDCRILHSRLSRTGRSFLGYRPRAPFVSWNSLTFLIFCSFTSARVALLPLKKLGEW